MCLRAGIHKNGMTVFSAHQMGTARMGASAKSSVVDPRGECWHVANLYVADASLFPTSTGAHAASHAARLNSSSLTGQKACAFAAPAHELCKA